MSSSCLVLRSQSDLSRGWCLFPLLWSASDSDVRRVHVRVCVPAAPDRQPSSHHMLLHNWIRRRSTDIARSLHIPRHSRLPPSLESPITVFTQFLICCILSPLRRVRLTCCRDATFLQQGPHPRVVRSAATPALCLFVARIFLSDAQGVGATRRVCVVSGYIAHNTEQDVWKAEVCVSPMSGNSHRRTQALTGKAKTHVCHNA